MEGPPPSPTTPPRSLSLSASTNELPLSLRATEVVFYRKVQAHQGLFKQAVLVILEMASSLDVQSHSG